MNSALGSLRPRPALLLLAAAVLGGGCAAYAVYAAYAAHAPADGGWRRLRRRLRRRRRESSLSGAGQSLLDCLLVADTAAGDVCRLPFVCRLSGHSCLVAIGNKLSVLHKLREMATGGPDNLEVITDFDFTLSRFRRRDGARNPSCHGVVEGYPGLTEQDRLYFKSLRDHYYPIEIAPSIAAEEKVQRMVEWWTKSHDRMLAAGFQQSVLAHSVDESGVQLRHGWRQLFATVERLGIPCLIFSAGIGDVIQEILDQLGVGCGAAVRIVSNFMRFDSQGLLCGFTEPMIHTFNKTFAAFASAGAGASCRRNLLLMGDSMGDLRMGEGCNASLVLSVGFLNDRIEERLPSYVDAYDIVCLEEATLCVPLAILDFVGATCSLPPPE